MLPHRGCITPRKRSGSRATTRAGSRGGGFPVTGRSRAQGAITTMTITGIAMMTATGEIVAVASGFPVITGTWRYGCGSPATGRCVVRLREETPCRSSRAGTPLRKSLWNLLYRVISSSDHSRTAWGAILRGSCLAFFKETIDDLPTADNEASCRALKDLFFGLPDHRIWDLFEFLLTDDRAGMKEVDRKL